MKTGRDNTFLVIMIMAVIVIVIVYLMPILASVFSRTDVFGLLMSRVYGFMPAYLKSCSFAISSALFCTVGGLQLALCMRCVPMNSRMGLAMSLLIMPMALGNMTVAYLLKCSLYGSALFDYVMGGGYWTQTVVMLVIQFWIYGLLFAYLFWIGIQTIPEKYYDYGEAIGVSGKEEIRDLVLPKIKTLFVVLFVLAFIFSFYELPKSQFVFKASQGMGTELANHALTRIYQVYSMVNPALAGITIFKAGCSVAFCTLILVGTCGFCVLKGYTLLLKGKYVPLVCMKSRCVAPVCLFCTLLPIMTGLYYSRYSIDVGAVVEMLFPITLTFLAALCATVYAVMFGIASRLAFPTLLSRFKTGSLLYIMAIFLLQLFPPVCLMVCGYGWLSMLGYDRVLVCTVWIAGHTLLVFPVLGSFVVASHFSVRNDEIEWQKVHGVAGRVIVSQSFLKRFKAEYILTFLFAYTMIWNDMTINTILSDYIPSFADRMQRLFVGRATDDAKATLFAMLSILISISCVYVWTRVIRRNYANS